MQNNLTELKITIVAILGLLSSWLGVLAIPVYILVGENIIDYVTALFATSKRGIKISSQIGIEGIKKKVCMWILIVIGVFIDILLKYTADIVGISLPFTFLISCLVAAWLCWNELISILENTNDILGEDMPSFLLPLTKNIRSQVENKLNIDNKGDDNND